LPENTPTEARVSPSEAAALRQRGDALLATGDVASARLFYERAATAGDTMAALRLGEAHDPLFLAQAGITGVRGDRAVAARWYRRATELGATEAEILLKSTENERE
jgi:TPR repeat protein